MKKFIEQKTKEIREITMLLEASNNIDMKRKCCNELLREVENLKYYITLLQ